MNAYTLLRMWIQYSIYLWTQTWMRIWSKSTDWRGWNICGSGHCACSLVGPHHGCGPNKVDGIYDVTIARHQTLRSYAHTCLAYINQAKQIFIAPYWNVIIIRYWINTEPQNCINWSVLDRTDPLFPGSFEHYQVWQEFWHNCSLYCCRKCVFAACRTKISFIYSKTDGISLHPVVVYFEAAWVSHSLLLLTNFFLSQI